MLTVVSPMLTAVSPMLTPDANRLLNAVWQNAENGVYSVSLYIFVLPAVQRDSVTDDGGGGGGGSRSSR